MGTSLPPTEPPTVSRLRKIAAALVLLALLTALVAAARLLASQLDVVELLRKLHGG